MSENVLPIDTLSNIFDYVAITDRKDAQEGLDIPDSEIIEKISSYGFSWIEVLNIIENAAKEKQWMLDHKGTIAHKLHEYLFNEIGGYWEVWVDTFDIVFWIESLPLDEESVRKDTGLDVTKSMEGHFHLRCNDPNEVMREFLEIVRHMHPTLRDIPENPIGRISRGDFTL